jgi:hypothetical protein
MIRRCEGIGRGGVLKNEEEMLLHRLLCRHGYRMLFLSGSHMFMLP